MSWFGFAGYKITVVRSFEEQLCFGAAIFFLVGGTQIFVDC